MTAADLTTWVDGSVRAWASNDPDDVGRLFTDDATYYAAPFREPWRGRAAIVAGWLDRKDEQGDCAFRYEVLAVADDLGVVRGWTTYTKPPTAYSNLWLVRLAAEGRCVEFTEWWMVPTDEEA